MPNVKINLTSRYTREEAIKIKDAFVKSAIESLNLRPPSLVVYVNLLDEDFFSGVDPTRVSVDMTLFAGRARDVKVKFYKDVCQAMADSIGVEKERFHITLYEFPRENFGQRGGTPADEA